jgi:hypothetical protein
MLLMFVTVKVMQELAGLLMQELVALAMTALEALVMLVLVAEVHVQEFVVSNYLF